MRRPDRQTGPGDPKWRKPITGIAFCCAWAANGHAVIAPPASRVSSSRRFTDHLIGAGGQPDIVRNPNVRHHSPGRNGKCAAIAEQHTLMDEDTPLPFDLPAVTQSVARQSGWE